MAGYFDNIKTPKAPPIPVTPVEVRTEGLHPYAAGAIAAELGRLKALPRPWHEGANWDTVTFEVACNLLEFANSPWSGYSHAQAQTDLFGHAPSDDRWGPREHAIKWRSAQQRIGVAGRPEPAPGASYAVTVLEDAPELTADAENAFWDARPLLRHLHDFARARRVSPWAVLGVTLARIITATPHQVCLPPIVGGKASLNLFVGLVGPSGAGKGAAEAVAADAFHVGYIVSHNVGSGEGIAHGYMKRSRGGDLDWVDDAHAVLFSVPEIDSLAAQGMGRKGATLMPQLRSGWTGEQLGFGYADPTKRIIVPAHEYRLCLVAGIQPGRAACLLDDADGGTPQRFLWMPATDPGAPDVPPAEPTPMTWTPPRTGDLVGIGGARMGVCDTASHAITSSRLARLRGEGDALDGHALLAQLKTAAALAVADGRLDVNDEDWSLGGVIAAKSARVRAGVVDHLARKSAELNAARAEGEAIRAVQVEERVADAAVQRAARIVLRNLKREGDWTPLSTIKRGVSSVNRGHVEEALTALLEAGLIEAEVDDYHGQERRRYRAVKDEA